MKILKLIAVCLTLALAAAACKSSDTPPPETTPATQPAETGTEGEMPSEGESE